MADGLDVVAIRILHEPAVVVGMVFWPEAGLAIVLATGGQSGGIECPHSSPVLRHECDMHGSARLALSQPQGRCVLGAEAYQSVALVLDCEPQGSQSGRVETLARLEVLHLKLDVIKHNSLLLLNFSFSDLFLS